MKRSRLNRGTGLLVLLLALTACGSLVAPERELSSVMRDYTMRLRWMDTAGAARHFDGRHRDDFLQRFGDMRDLHVVDVTLDALEFSEDDRRADTTILLEYYMLPSATVERFRLRQEWVYQDAGRYHPGVWRIVTPFPAFP